jgi:hypothetical protein
MTNSNILPGMVNRSIEVFVVENETKAIHNGKVIDFSELPLGIVELLKEEIKKDTAVELALHDWHPFSEWKRVEQFATCRLGGLDHSDDITPCGKIQDGEYWNCPNRGKCQYEGTLCKLPVINNHRLNKEEIKLMQYSTTEMTNEVIAEEMNMALGSFHKAKAQLHQILGIQTKQGITKYCSFFNLI